MKTEIDKLRNAWEQNRQQALNTKSNWQQHLGPDAIENIDETLSVIGTIAKETAGKTNNGRAFRLAKETAVTQVNQAYTILGQCPPNAFRNLHQFVNALMTVLPSIHSTYVLTLDATGKDISRLATKLSLDLNTTQKIRSDAENESKKISDIVDAINKAHSDAAAATQNVEEMLDDIQGKQSEANGAANDAKAESQEISQLKTDAQGLLEQIKTLAIDAEDSQELLEQEIRSLKESEESLEAQQKRMETVRRELEGLLPGATAARLAHGYVRHKKGIKTRLKAAQKQVFYGVIAMGGLIAGSHFFLPPLTGGFTDLITGLVARVSFSIPAIWYTVLYTKEYRRLFDLYEDYSHKQTVAYTFEGLRRMMEELDDSTQENHLTRKLSHEAIDAFSDNPNHERGEKKTQIRSQPQTHPVVRGDQNDQGEIA